jgi:tetratricopeptide (TPR) repeat protein
VLERDFDRYRLLKRLGRGGMADVYLAHDRERDIEVALKIVEMGADADSREICDAERRGAILQDQFSRVDSHVPLVHRWGTFDSWFFIDMEYVEGEDLAERAGRGRLLPAEAAWIGAEICRFLERAHSFEAEVEGTKVRGIIHGDLKPRNVRVTPAGQIKVLDFGIAKGLSLSRKLTRNDFGSVTYMSPERLDSGDVDVHSDLWSAGVVLYELVAGTVPFQAGSTPRLEARIRSREPVAPLPDTCPPGLARVILKQLAGDMGRRYASASELRDDLEAFREGRETRADREWLGGDPNATRRTAPEPDATRRTSVGDGPTEETVRTATAPPPAEDEEPTQRTAAAVAVAPPVEAPAAVTAAPSPPSRARRMLRVALVLGLLGVLMNEASVWSDARQLRVDLATRPSAEAQQLWDRYRELSNRSLLRFGVAGLRAPMRERLMAQAERVIADYRQDAPAVREAQWRLAAASLTDVLQLDPSDRSALARLRYCEGHLQRIDGETRKRRRQQAAQPLHTAAQKFEEAAQLDGRWPDPYLGLARTYIYGLDDLDRAIAALHEAEKRGYRPGNRELVQLADGYRSRGDRMRRDAQGVRGLDQEKDYLEKALEDYRQSFDLYRQAMGFGEVSANMRQMQVRIDEVETRLEAIKGRGLGGLLRDIFGK